MNTDPLPPAATSTQLSSTAATSAATDKIPDWRNRASFFVRSELLKARRWFVDTARGPGRATHTDNLKEFSFVIGESITRLRGESEEAGERAFIRGKLENLRRACAGLNGSVVEAGETFSFWKQVGPPWRARGFVRGREIRGGCVIPSTGGGLCQISGALFEATSAAGLEIIERHAHTYQLPQTLYVAERDATVFWNYVDFRFRATDAVVIEARMTPDELIVRVRSKKPRAQRAPSLSGATQFTSTDDPAHFASSCLTCGQTTCARHKQTLAIAPRAGLGVVDSHFKTAALVDQYVPEFAAHLRGELVDVYLLPAPRLLSSLAASLGFSRRYHWPVPKSASSRASWLTWLARALYMRWGSRRGRIAATLRLRTNEWLAKSYARMLPWDIEHVIVSQDFLPFLWRAGVLQGRSFEVLLTRPALSVVHERLEAAREMIPQAKALAEFRAPPAIVEAESEALVYADRVITPHADLAKMYPRIRKLNWTESSAKPPADVRRPRYLLFPASLATREGAQAAIEVAEELDLPLLVVGSDLEGLAGDSDLIDFVTPGEIPWHEVAAVVHPTLFASWPRLHLHALAIEIPVICSEFVGLEESSLVTLVPFGREEELRRAVERALLREGDAALESHLEAVLAAEALSEPSSSARPSIRAATLPSPVTEREAARRLDAQL